MIRTLRFNKHNVTCTVPAITIKNYGRTRNIIHPLIQQANLRLVGVVCVSDCRILRGDPSLPARREPRLGVRVEAAGEYHRTRKQGYNSGQRGYPLPML